MDSKRKFSVDSSEKCKGGAHNFLRKSMVQMITSRQDQDSGTEDVPGDSGEEENVGDKYENKEEREGFDPKSSYEIPATQRQKRSYDNDLISRISVKPVSKISKESQLDHKDSKNVPRNISKLSLNVKSKSDFLINSKSKENEEINLNDVNSFKKSKTPISSTSNAFVSKDEEIVETLNSAPLQFVIDYVHDQLSDANRKSTEEISVKLAELINENQKIKSSKESTDTNNYKPPLPKISLSTIEKRKVSEKLFNPIDKDTALLNQKRNFSIISNENLSKNLSDKPVIETKGTRISNGHVCPAEISININKCGCICKSYMPPQHCHNSGINCQPLVFCEDYCRSNNARRNPCDNKINKLKMTDYKNDNDDDTEQLLNLCRKYLPEKKSPPVSYGERYTSNTVSLIHNRKSQIPIIPSGIPITVKEDIRNDLNKMRCNNDNRNSEVMPIPFRINRNIPLISNGNIGKESAYCEPSMRNLSTMDYSKCKSNLRKSSFLMSSINTSAVNSYGGLGFPFRNSNIERKCYDEQFNTSSTINSSFCTSQVPLKCDFKHISTFNRGHAKVNPYNSLRFCESNLSVPISSNNYLQIAQGKVVRKPCKTITNKYLDHGYSLSQLNYQKSLPKSSLKTYSSSQSLSDHSPCVCRTSYQSPTNIHKSSDAFGYIYKNKSPGRCNSSYTDVTDDRTNRRGFNRKDNLLSQMYKIPEIEYNYEECLSSSDSSSTEIIINRKEVNQNQDNIKMDSIQSKCSCIVSKGSSIIHYQPLVKMKLNNELVESNCNICERIPKMIERCIKSCVSESYSKCTRDNFMQESKGSERNYKNDIYNDKATECSEKVIKGNIDQKVPSKKLISVFTNTTSDKLTQLKSDSVIYFANDLKQYQQKDYKNDYEIKFTPSENVTECSKGKVYPLPIRASSYFQNKANILSHSLPKYCNKSCVSKTYSEVSHAKLSQHYISDYFFDTYIKKEKSHLLRNVNQSIYRKSIEFEKKISRTNSIEKIRKCNANRKTEKDFSKISPSDIKIENVLLETMLNKKQAKIPEREVLKEVKKSKIEGVSLLIEIPIVLDFLKQGCQYNIATQTSEVCKCSYLLTESPTSLTMSCSSSQEQCFVDSSSEYY